MSILFNGGNDPSTIIFNGTDLSKVIYNGTVIWEKYREVTPLDYENDIPAGIKSNPSYPDYPYYDTLVASPYGYGDMYGPSIEPYMGQYEVGFWIQDIYHSPEVYSVGSFIVNRRASTEVDITRYNTCLVEAYAMNASKDDNIQFRPGGTTRSHQVGVFTMMNDTELRACCGNWVDKGNGYYWWDTQQIYPNSLTIPYIDYDPILVPSPRPDDWPATTPDWWSEISNFHKFGFAFHTEYGEWGESHWCRARGPIMWTKVNLPVYGQAVKFSVRGLTGVRPVRCMMYPQSTNGTYDTSETSCSGTARGGVILTKITLNTTICDPND